MAIFQYIQDYDEKYSPSVVINGATGPQTADTRFGTRGATWAGLISPYVKNTQIFNCPSQSRENRIDGYAVEGGLSYIGTRKCAGTANPDEDGVFMGYPGCTTPLNAAAVPKPAETVLLWEVGSNNGIMDWYDAPVGVLWPQRFIRPDYWNERHFEGFNLAWMDGHVKWMKLINLRGEHYTATADDTP